MRPRLDFDVLVPLAQLGDKKALDTLAHFVYYHGLTVVKRRCPNTSHELRMEGINQVVINLLEGSLLRGFRGDCTFLGFLYPALINAVKDEERKDRLRRRAERSYDSPRNGGGSWRDFIPDTLPGPERQAEVKQELAQVMARLTDREARIALAVMEGESLVSLARSEGVSVAALRQRVSRMRRRLNQQRGELNAERQVSSETGMPLPDLHPEASESAAGEDEEPFEFDPRADCE